MQKNPGVATQATQAWGDVQFIGTPDQILENARTLQEKTSAHQVVVLFHFGGVSDVDAERSMRLFAKDVLPELKAMPTPLHDSALGGVAAA